MTQLPTNMPTTPTGPRARVTVGSAMPTAMPKGPAEAPPSVRPSLRPAKPINVRPNMPGIVIFSLGSS